MTVSVLIVTYKRAKNLRYALDSLANQSVKPDEVVIVLKPSNDNSQQVISEFYKKLNIRLLIQEQGDIIEAYSMGIAEASKEILLFMDDDAIAQSNWVSRYLQLFNKYQNAGAIQGLIMQSYILGDKAILDDKPHAKEESSKGPYRKPLNIFNGYCEYLTESGLQGASKRCLSESGDIIKSCFFVGANMGFRRRLITDLPFPLLFKGSKKAFYSEMHIVVYVIKKGYDALRARSPSIAPIVYHSVERNSLTRSKDPKEFLAGKDRSMNFWRLKMVGVEVSLLQYMIGQIIILRRETLLRLLALLYSLLYGPYLLRYYRQEMLKINANKSEPLEERPTSY